MRIYKIFFIIAVSLLFSSLAAAQQANSENASEESKMIFSGNLTADTKIAQDAIMSDEVASQKLQISRKSPVLAGLMSLAVPGAGEIYSGSYWKALAFIAVEAAAITANIYYNKKGDDATKEFQAFAEEHWSARRYAEWINKFSTDLNVTTPAIDLEKVDRHDFAEIRRAEDQVVLKSASGDLHFSHKLPDYQSQQYYELIGKYHQYNHGWDDSDPNTVEWVNNLSERFHKYADMHIKPDDTYYKYASQAVTVLVLNHIISAVDAIWTASRYNKRVQVDMSMKTEDMLGMLEFYPQMNIRVNF
ncbi:MAG: hypothetical protein ACM3SM_10810 [Bacteroidota bacterium]